MEQENFKKLRNAIFKVLADFPKNTVLLDVIRGLEGVKFELMFRHVTDQGKMDLAPKEIEE